jgi:hypothetical protein
MNRKITEIQDLIADALNALPGVFSTVQWGGRAYKVGPRKPRKQKLLAHVFLSEKEDAVCVAFKLSMQRAAAVVEDFDWITPHSFRTLGGAGWVSAEVRSSTHVKVIERLLRESRSLHPLESSASESEARRGKPDANSAPGEIVVRRLSEIVAAKKAEGWQPNQADDFDD